MTELEGICSLMHVALLPHYRVDE